jgi:hypothetical protein
MKRQLHQLVSLCGSCLKAYGLAGLFVFMFIVLGALNTFAQSSGGGIYSPDFSSVSTAVLAIIATAAGVGILFWGSKYVIAYGLKILNMFRGR